MTQVGLFILNFISFGCRIHDTGESIAIEEVVVYIYVDSL